MALGAKTLETMNAHLTQSEIEIRQEAERETMPDRPAGVQLKPPPLMAGVTKAAAYWKAIMKRMEGLVILDDLDSDTLGIYCVQLARYDAAVKDLRAARAALKTARGDKTHEADTEAVAAALAQLSALEKQMQKLETTMLQYAEKLGLTPSGRVRLAQKRAAAAAEKLNDPDGDLFGD